MHILCLKIYTHHSFPPRLTVSHPFKVMLLSQSLLSLSFFNQFIFGMHLLAFNLPLVNQSPPPILFLSLYLSHSLSLRPFRSSLHIINHPPPQHPHTNPTHLSKASCYWSINQLIVWPHWHPKDWKTLFIPASPIHRTTLCYHKIHPLGLQHIYFHIYY